MRHLIIFCLFIIAGWTSMAQVEFTATPTRDKIAINERVRVEFKMNVAGDNFTPPNFEGFQVVSGPIQSFSQQWVNGKSSMSKSYSYILKPNKTGKVTIKQAVMEFEGAEYKTVPFQIAINGAVDDPKDANSQEITADTDIHLVAEVSKANPYLNEPIKVVYKLYVANNTGVSGWNEIDSPKYPDFWSLNIDNRNAQVKNGNYLGQPYRYLQLREVVLYPQKTGELVIEPLTLDINVEVPTNRRDFFGRTVFKTVSKTVSAGSRKINVKSIPTAGRPASYTGAVGDFKFKVELDKAQLDAGESLNAVVKVGGTGNLKLMELPKLKVPQSLEAYEPERGNAVKTSISGMKGTISDTYVIVPQYGGKYVLPPVEFSYFDPKKETFITLNSGETLIEVNGPAPASGTNVTSNSATGSNKNYINNDAQFAFIKTTTDFINKEQTYFFNSTGYWTVIGCSLLLMPLSLLVRRKQEAIASDVVGNRLKTANKLSKKYLSAAKKNLGNHDQFYISLEKSLHNYLKSKLNIQTAEMSKDRVSELLLQRGAAADTNKEFIELLASCEFARYTPSSDSGMQQDFDKASRVINEIDKQLKR
ncbi:protein BatD [Nonlabens mediterrranea]|uniref:Protein BatD n=2 Tax=Nonlabens mediterrranea TaxID=1419947 RepID=A0ABS0A812_9FLAO|nr:putative BatD-like protein [Flavobacteria bacterium BBFL7]MBF4985439.1 protein BatD [Nonlabens mediterrranea]